MKKRFNTTGTCFPDQHYMMDNSGKLDQVMALIERGEYFTISRPRQYGKTTILFTLSEKLKISSNYFPIFLNFQGIDSKWNETDTAFAKMFISELHKFFEYSYPDVASFIEEQTKEITDMGALSRFITHLANRFDKKLILLIDEVDASSNYDAFLNFLGMLRTKYLGRVMPNHHTFFSIVLAGVHDVKNLKFKLRNPHQAQYNSPWNIATEFKVEMSFNPTEIAPMLHEYSRAEGISMDIPTIAQRLHYHTAGYPFLVSRLCQIIAEDILPERENPTNWTLEDVEMAVQLLLKEENTNFESVFKNLENNNDLYDLAYEVLIEGTVIPFNPNEPVTKLGRIYGIFKDNGRLRIHNRIYEQLIYDYMATKELRLFLQNNKRRFDDTAFANTDNTLDMQRVLLSFQQFMKEQRSQKDMLFLERHWRLIFLAFLKPIINGKGHDFKEVETSEEKRLDIVVTYFQHKYIIELKIWRGEKSHQNGLNQLAQYLDIHSLDKSYLLIFDTRQHSAHEQKSLQHQEKEIFAVWV